MLVACAACDYEHALVGLRKGACRVIRRPDVHLHSAITVKKRHRAPSAERRVNTNIGSGRYLSFCPFRSSLRSARWAREDDGGCETETEDELQLCRTPEKWI